MKTNIWKSIGAVAAGFALGAVLSIAADVLFGKMGWMNMEDFKQTSSTVVLLVILYRFLFNVLGCYLAARLAPTRPLFHAMIIGYIGLFLSILGSVVMWDKAYPWYNLSIVLISLPCAWLGGKWGERSISKTPV